MRRAFDLLGEHGGERLDPASVPTEDPATYAMIRKADTVGIFQIESRAQIVAEHSTPRNAATSGRDSEQPIVL